jgi:TPR repeat protein
MCVILFSPQPPPRFMTSFTGPDCLGRLAEAYHTGKGTPKDNEKALLLARQSASMNSAFGQLMMGYLCEAGLAGEPSDDVKAFNWYKLAAEQNHPEALNTVGKCYFNGDGVQQDKRQAFEYFKRSADLKYSDALVNLGRMYEFDLAPIADADLFDHTRLTRNAQFAFKCFLEAADLDDPRGCLNAAIFYQKGFGGGGANWFNAFRMFKKGAALGDVMCMVNVAKLHDSGIFQPHPTDGTMQKILNKDYRYGFVQNKLFC